MARRDSAERPGDRGEKTTAPAAPRPKTGEIVTLTVESLAFGGKGIARLDGYTVFVEGGLPGQSVEARLVRRKRTFAEARVVRVVTPSPLQVTPRCAHFGTCGGCALQHLDLTAQLEAKRAHVRDALIRIGGFPDPEVEPTLPSPEPFEYRNKMEYSFAPRWLEESEIDDDPGDVERFGLGLHVRRRFDRVVNVERCHLQGEEASAILRAARDLTRAGGIPAYSTQTHRGFWRFLVVREGRNTGERMVVLITNEVPPGSKEWREVERVAEALRARSPRITSLIHGMTAAKGAVAFCRDMRTLAGDPVIREKLLDHMFEIGPNTFFQTNTRGAEQLFTEALDRGDFAAGETVWDLYSGVGALSLPLARRVGRVTGIEVVPEAVEAAQRNAAANRVTNVAFLAGDVRALLAGLAERDGGRPPHAVVLDPPRDGMHPDVARGLIAAAPRRIVYVSCNPASFARDAALLREGGYRLGPVRPVDMFPHTAHVECVGRFDRVQS